MSLSSESSMIDKFLTALVVGLISWNLYTTQQLSVQVARLEERMNIVDILKGN